LNLNNETLSQMEWNLEKKTLYSNSVISFSWGLMSELMNVAYQILYRVLDWGIPFTLGVLFRKRVGRFLIKIKRWLFNDVVTMNILCVRSYNPTEICEVNHSVYEDIKVKIPSAKLLTVFPDGLKISVPIFGNVRTLLETVVDEEDSTATEEVIEKIKLSLNPESPVRLGMREIEKLTDFANYCEAIIGALEKCCIAKSKITQNFLLVEVPRIQHFREEKTFQIENKELGATIHATPEKLTIVVSPMTYIGRAISKYVLT
jgi:hypothetical protein